MAGKTTCPRCGRVGQLRVEHVIKGGKSYRSCECTACGHHWQLAETGEHVPSTTDDRPDRSRSNG
jgi:hypothetical protein